MAGISLSKDTKKRFENIVEDNNVVDWLPTSCNRPETPTESMEFLARAWSFSATELSKALCNTNEETKHAEKTSVDSHGDIAQTDNGCSMPSKIKPLLTSESPPLSPRVSDETKQFYRNIMKRKTIGRKIKDQKEKKKQEIRAHNAQLHAAVSVAGVAAAVAALTSSSSSTETKSSSKMTSSFTAIASAAALVASHCIEIAEHMGANHEQIISVVTSAINAKTNGDIITLTAGAATALRGASTLRTRLYKEYGAPTISLSEENIWNIKESSISVALDFVSKGGELLKCTRKGDLHWKHVFFNINSNCQVVAKMKSKHIGGTFTKKKKYIVSGIYSEIPDWTGRETEEEGKGGQQISSYFAIQTDDRIIEFECRNKSDKQMWVQGIQHMLHLN